MTTHIRRYTALQDRLLMALIYIFVFFSMVVILIPILFVISSSFSSPSAIAQGKVFLLPVDFSLKGYSTIFQSAYIFRGFFNTIVYTAAGTLVSLIVTILAAYPLSRGDLVGRNAVMFFYAFTMLFGGGMIPTYLVVRQLGMLNTIWAMILPSAVSVWNIIITRTYFQANIPRELYECASLDGCRDFTFLLRIVLPLSKPIIAVVVLFYAVWQWNSYFNALLYLSLPSMQPLQIILRDILISGTNLPNMNDIGSVVESEYMKNLLQYSLIIVSSLPVMLLYPFIQKYFVKGIMIGAIKG